MSPGSLRHRAPVSKKCPESVPGVKRVFRTLRGHSRDTFWTLRTPGGVGPRRHPLDTPSNTPRFRDTLGDTPETLRARRAQRLLWQAGGFSTAEFGKAPEVPGEVGVNQREWNVFVLLIYKTPPSFLRHLVFSGSRDGALNMDSAPVVCVCVCVCVNASRLACQL